MFGVYLHVLIYFQLEMVVQIGMPPKSYAVKKNFPYARFLNYEITKLRESGMIDVILARNQFRPPQCQDQESEETNQEKMSLQKVILPFTLILIGMTLACIILSIENIYDRI